MYQYDTMVAGRNFQKIPSEPYFMTEGTGGLFLLGIPAFIIGMLMIVRTRAILQFRSPGDIKPKSISEWQIRVWQGIGATVSLLGIGLIALSLTV